jgi:nitrogen regulation protein NR(I)
MSKILIVDDEQSVLAAFEELLTEQGHVAITAKRGDLALARVESDEPDLVILDVQMPGMSGLEAFQRIRQRSAKLPVIIMTGHGTTESAIEATKLGAFDYLLKPVDPESMLRIVAQALEGVRLMRRHVELDTGALPPTSDAIVGQSLEMQEVYKTIGRVAQTDATVLIRGESGTGKELVARAIYQHSRRSAAPLTAINCAAIPEPLLESELFGHERGAFTGATARRIGKFEQAGGGTIFLDEVGDMPLNIQTKILRVLQERVFERIGGNETIRVDVRVLAATNRDLEQAIMAGTFREDLYHRLNVVTIQIPPLRQRRDDIPKLTSYFLGRIAHELQIAKPPISDEALDVLCRQSWPGNVRELEHSIHRALIFTGGHPVQAADVRQAMGQSTASASLQSASSFEDRVNELVLDYLVSHSGSGTHEGLVNQVEKALLLEALKQASGNRSNAARLLGMPRPTLHAKMQKYGIRLKVDPRDVQSPRQISDEPSDC